MRVISPTECERLLGFEPGWTHVGGTASPGLGFQRRNAVGNVFAVQVITRLIMGLALVVKGEATSAFPMWADRQLAAPYRHDVLDDVFTEAAFIANSYRDLTTEFDDYIEPHWHGGLVGPDPEAGGRKSRTQRTAAIGVQQNTHLSRAGLQLLIPEPRLGPQEHVALARTLLHPFSYSHELPLDLMFAAELSACYPEETAELRSRKLKRLQ